MGMVDARCVRSSMIYGSETRPLLADVGLKFERAEMQIIRWMCDVSMKDRRTSEELIMVVGVVIRSGRLYSSTVRTHLRYKFACQIYFHDE